MTTLELRRWGPNPVRQLVRRRADVWLAAASGVAATEARRGAPVRTGRLRDSIAPLPLERRDGQATAGVWAQAPYALWVEIGTTRMAAQPYLEPALETVQDATGALVGQARVAVPEVGS